LLLDPPILVMDEPTSGMDVGSEAKLKQNLDKVVAERTLILITHRFSLLDIVDRLIVLDHGRVVADGPKQQVLDQLKQGAVKGARGTPKSAQESGPA
ncbi:MAG: type I secretion system permease/ATPase, partial [Alphaproteobacteria bacterium]|nr:type I secretion system permease/ATPase [Alphaproteobacteria bacterium]